MGVAHLTRDILEHDLFELNMMKHETPVFKPQQLPVNFFCIVAAKFDPREARSQSIDSAMALRSFLLLLVARAAAVSVDELAQWFASAQGASDCQWSSHHSLSPSTDHWYPDYPGFNYMTSDARKLAEQAGWSMWFRQPESPERIPTLLRSCLENNDSLGGPSQEAPILTQCDVSVQDARPGRLLGKDV